MADPSPMPWRAVLAATSALLVGIGLTRFAYSPLLPAVISQGWFQPGEAAYIGAANLLGYLFGALAARRVASSLGTASVLRGAMFTAAVSLVACSVPMPFLWFFAWRLLSGVLGGLLMILGPSLVMPHIPPGRRGVAGGVVFTGVGGGIALSGTMVPLLIRWGLTEAWLGLAVACFALTAFAWRSWPAAPIASTVVAHGARGRFGAMCVSYGLCAFGFAPHMVFLVDYVARGLGRGLDAGAFTWVLFGVGAVCGPVVVGRLADRLGPELMVRVVIGVETLTVAALLLAGGNLLVIDASALLGGTVVTGITVVTLARVGARAGASALARQRGWTQATVAWAIGQAAGTYGMAWLFGAIGGYAPMFIAALAALAGAVVIEVALALQPTSEVAA